SGQAASGEMPSALPGQQDVDEPGTPPAPIETFGPIEYFFRNEGGSPPARTRRSARLTLRLARDPQFLLAIAIALPVLAVEGSHQLAAPRAGGAGPRARLG